MRSAIAFATGASRLTTTAAGILASSRPPISSTRTETFVPRREPASHDQRRVTVPPGSTGASRDVASPRTRAGAPLPPPLRARLTARSQALAGSATRGRSGKRTVPRPWVAPPDLDDPKRPVFSLRTSTAARSGRGQVERAEELDAAAHEYSRPGPRRG